MNADVAQPGLRVALRSATQDVHARLHLHAGCAAVQRARIGWVEYRDLLARLHGFYAPFEAAAGVQPDRTLWLAEDLATLDPGRALDTVPACPYIPRLDDPQLRLGARYVAEGAALGGRELARGLDHLLGRDATLGRRFFTGRGADTGEAWRRYLQDLAAAPPGPAAWAQVIKGAVETFAVFENWLTGWSTSTHGRI